MDITVVTYLLALFIGSLFAYRHGNRFIILLMWVNLYAVLSVQPSVLGASAVDVLTAWVLLMVVQSQAAFLIAAIFCVMALIYPLSILIGSSATYTLVDFLAYVQILAMGAGGFGTAIRSGRSRYKRLFNPVFPNKENELDTTAGVPVVARKTLEQRIK